jgi:hypothetical protein
MDRLSEIYDLLPSYLATESNTVETSCITSTPTPTPTPTPVPVYTVSGSVFNDTNKNKLKDAGEANYTGGINITSSRGTMAINSAAGTFTLSGLVLGSQTVSFNSLPVGYNMIYPLNGPPPSFITTVGPACAVDGTTGATCSGGNISNLNFSISNSIPWIQAYDFDVRFDNGYTDTIPQAPVYTPYLIAQDAGAQTSGLVFSGDSFSDFGQGKPSSANWVVGGAQYPEVSSGTNSSVSYAVLLNKAKQGGIPVTDLSTVAGCAANNCTLPNNLANGIYQAKGNLTLNAHVFNGNKNYIFLINGNLTILGNIQVQNGSTATFATTGSVIIDKAIGVAAISPLPVGQVQGVFSSGKDFVIQGTNNCVTGADKMLNVEGAIILPSGGKFTNQRDLCGGNPQYPTFTLKGRTDFILNAPIFLMQQHTISNEVSP